LCAAYNIDNPLLIINGGAVARWARWDLAYPKICLGRPRGIGGSLCCCSRD